MKKKILSFFLTFAMILSMTAMFAGTVSAADETPTVTINTYEQLETFIAGLATDDYADDYVVLGADITVNEGWVANDGTANAVTAPTGEKAKTLDTAAATTAFAGTFDGQNHTISGLYMTGKAFFPAIKGATIKNVTFDNCGSNRTGGHVSIVAGEQQGGTFEFTNVVVKNSKIVNNTSTVNLGTLVGKITSATSAKFTDCKTIACNLYTSAGTSYVGGIVGYVVASTAFLRCSSDTDIVAKSTSESDKCKSGGMIGTSSVAISITECANSGDIISQAYAGGMVGDVSSKAVTIEDCVNRGNMAAEQILGKDCFAGGMVGRYNNAYGCSITGSANYGKISASTEGTSNAIYAGGMVGFCQNKTDAEQEQIKILQSLNAGEIISDRFAGGVMGRLYYGELTVTDYANTGSVTSDYNAGGILGEATKNSSHRTILFLTNFVNTADITATNKAGGLVGVYVSVSGTIDKVITVGTIKGFSKSDYTPVAELIEAETKPNTGASCAAFGQWNQDVVEGKSVAFVDFFYSNSISKNIFGLWAELGTAKNAHAVSYTATGATLDDFVPGTTNTDESELNADGEYKNTQGANLSLYNQFFVANGYLDTLIYDGDGNLSLGKIANTFKAFNLGVDWMLTDTVPVPASVFALMNEKDIVEGEVDYVGYQANAGTTLTSVRVIAGLDSTEYTNTGFELYLVKAGEEALYVDKNTTTVYTSLNVYGENGDALPPYLASEAGYAYLSAINVSCSADQLGDVTTLIVKPYVTAKIQDEDVKIYGASCAILIEKVEGVLTIADQYVM